MSLLLCISAAVKRTGCDVPMDIENGNWIIQSLFADYRIGVRVIYELSLIHISEPTRPY